MAAGGGNSTKGGVDAGLPVVLQPTGYEALQAKMSWEGLRYGNPADPCYCTGRVREAAPRFTWPGEDGDKVGGQGGNARRRSVRSKS